MTELISLEALFNVKQILIHTSFNLCHLLSHLLQVLSSSFRLSIIILIVIQIFVMLCYLLTCAVLKKDKVKY